MTFTPWVPDNAPTIVTWENMIVSTKTNPKKILLNNVTGQITGGFWAIMGSSGGNPPLLSILSN